MKEVGSWAPRVRAFGWVLVLCGTASVDRAQVPVGDVVVLTENYVTPDVLHHFRVGTSNLRVITGLDPELAVDPRCIEIDPTTGDLIVVAGELNPGDGAVVWRVRLSVGPTATTAVSNDIIGRLQGGYEVVDTHREPSGCLLVLTRRLDDPSSPILSLHRFAVLPTGVWQGPRLPFEVPDPHDRPLSVTSDADGRIYIGYSRVFGGAGNPGVYVGSPAGGLLTDVSVGTKITPAGIEFDAAGNLALGGLRNPWYFGSPNFYWCGREYTYGTVGTYTDPAPVTWPTDILLASSRTSFYLGTWDPGLHGNGIGGALVRLSALACTPGVQAPLAVFHDQVLKVAERTAETGYGCPCPTSVATLPEIGEIASPVAGGTWTVTIEDGRPGAISLFAAALSNTEWRGNTLPQELATAPGCLLQQSLDAVPTWLVLDGNGAGSLTLNVPPGLSGWTVFSQWFLRDPALNPLGIAATAGLQSAVQ